jgi:endo-1,4-beta-xylanase
MSNPSRKPNHSRLLPALLATAGLLIIILAVILTSPAARDQAGGDKEKTGAEQAESAGNAARADIAPTVNIPISIDGPAEAPKPIQTDIPSLAVAFKDAFPIGAAIEPKETQGLHGEMLKKHFNSLVAGNAMKPASLQPREGEFDWKGADQIAAFARENGMELRFHTLVWHQQSPAWFFLDKDGFKMMDETDPARREENKKLLLERLDTHIRTVVARYKDDIVAWDVVNEVVDEAEADGMRHSDWYMLTGTDYIVTAFKAAREAAGEDAKLIINDFNTNMPKKRDILLRLVQDLLAQGVPIDGVGHQTHVNVEWPSGVEIVASIRAFSALGLDNQITELDMSVYGFNNRGDYGEALPEGLLETQAARYREIFDALLTVKEDISNVTFWGIADDNTWLNSFPVTRTDYPLPFDKELQAKPAFWALVDPSRTP